MEEKQFQCLGQRVTKAEAEKRATMRKVMGEAAGPELVEGQRKKDCGQYLDAVIEAVPAVGVDLPYVCACEQDMVLRCKKDPPPDSEMAQFWAGTLDAAKQGAVQEAIASEITAYLKKVGLTIEGVRVPEGAPS